MRGSGSEIHDGHAAMMVVCAVPMIVVMMVMAVVVSMARVVIMVMGAARIMFMPMRIICSWLVWYRPRVCNWSGERMVRARS